MPLENLLFSAIVNNNLSRVKTLLNQEIDVNIRNTVKKTPLHISVLNPDIAKLLIEKGADINAINKDGDTPLHTAVDLAEIETVCMLLHYNADPNVPNKDNETPFMKALMSGFAELQEALLDYVDDFKVDNNTEENLVAVALKYGSRYVQEIVLRGGNVDQKAIENFNFSDNNIDLFKFIWLRIPNSEIDEDTFGIKLIQKLCRGSATRNFGKYIDFLVENANGYIIETIASNLSNMPLRYFFSRCRRTRCLNQLTKFICLLLQYNFECTVRNKIDIFEIFGYCQLFEILLHFGLEDDVDKCMLCDLKCSSILPTYICFINTDIKTICDCKKNNPNLKSLINIMTYWAYPNLNKLLTKTILFPKFSNIYPNLPGFPSLVELARDKARQYIVSKFNMSKSSQYYTYLHCLNVPTTCKEILTFNRQIYKIHI
ncbi:unnamed protein product [Psylliodes chrysocephalus]|uniref:Ankyrin repeat protein n=1 Tax=Psylliodes chrysocephalus TaxID=3402493 RepID=A0A9P0CPT4_9CUCU|nr:unnamed protein product [Psylliodes chrysocephala]